jgi:hypothetical protein
MKFANITANHSLLGKASPTLEGSKGNRRFGSEDAIQLKTSDHMVARQILALSSGKIVTLDLATGLFTLPEEENINAVAQVETISAAGTITTAGSVALLVTSNAGAYGEFPRTFAVRVKVGDTASTWANKVRLQLSRDTIIQKYYTVGGSGEDISLTRRINLFGEQNDSGLTMELGNGTCSGVSSAESTATTAGVEFVGALVDLNTNTDAEGLTNPSPEDYNALLIIAESGALTVSDNLLAPETLYATIYGQIHSKAALQISGGGIPGTLEFQNNGTTLSARIIWAYEAN